VESHQFCHEDGALSLVGLSGLSALKGGTGPLRLRQTVLLTVLSQQQVAIAFYNRVVLLEVRLRHQVGVRSRRLARIHFRNGSSLFGRNGTSVVCRRALSLLGAQAIDVKMASVLSNFLRGVEASI
jgi:hypothetical protein